MVVSCLSDIVDESKCRASNLLNVLRRRRSTNEVSKMGTG